MSDLEPTPRTTLRRLPERGHFDRATVNAILDEALVCHVGFVRDGQPFVIPTIHARVGDHVLVHGSAASRMLKTLQGGVPVCLTVTLLDGLVLARSAFNHSMNYRSVVVLGEARAVTEPREKWDALHAIVEHVAPGRWSEVREPSARELAATLVLRLPIEEASAKVRTGPPHDDEEDYALECWAGVLPLRLTPGAPQPDPRMPAGRPLPPSVTGYARPR
jgi:nitroimidazol reductase NimA-like FMN-containing flavoprotein (pyridoxamine 5'-phosphate oxidase superfamily)